MYCHIKYFFFIVILYSGSIITFYLIFASAGYVLITYNIRIDSYITIVSFFIEEITGDDRVDVVNDNDFLCRLHSELASQLHFQSFSAKFAVMQNCSLTLGWLSVCSCVQVNAQQTGCSTPSIKLSSFAIRHNR